MRQEPSTALLDRVRKLLAKAEDVAVTPAEAEALTAKAAELMARYGIDRALLAATAPETDSPADRVITVHNPWAAVKAHLLTGLSGALRCQCVLLRSADPGSRVHVFGFNSDLERAEILYTSVLVQMARALAAAAVPVNSRSVRAWRRSWLLGYVSAVVGRVRHAEQAAEQAAGQAKQADGPSAALVLADRAVVIRERCDQAYPHTRTTKITYTGTGYGSGYREGQKADIGSTKLRRRPSRALTG